MSFQRNKPIWAEAFERLAEAERLQRQCFRSGAAQSPAWEPPIDLVETADKLVVVAALPGVAPEQIEVHLNSGQLIITGQRTLPRPAHGKMRIHRLELPYGRFERRVPLPAGNYELTEYRLLHGCLQLDLQKI